jgi:nucleoside-diphosphate-sugar epimerase
MNILVCGAGGFIGGYLTASLRQQGHTVVGADIKPHEYRNDSIDIIDLRDQNKVLDLFKQNNFDRVYQLAANMGGAGFIFTGDNDTDILNDSAQINLNVINAMRHSNVTEVLYTSSACVYPEHAQLDSTNATLKESQAYPADPDSDYGWEKLFSERLYLAAARNLGWRVRIARLHNIFGPLGAWNNGKEKAPAAICRKVAQTKNDTIDIWGSGDQTRSFLYIDECIEGIHRLWNSTCELPVNLGSERMISISELTQLIAIIAGKNIQIKSVAGPTGVSARASDNTLIKQLLGWAPQDNLEYGLAQTYKWIESQI